MRINQIDRMKAQKSQARAEAGFKPSKSANHPFLQDAELVGKHMVFTIPYFYDIVGEEPTDETVVVDDVTETLYPTAVMSEFAPILVNLHKIEKGGKVRPLVCTRHLGEAVKTQMGFEADEPCPACEAAAKAFSVRRSQRDALCQSTKNKDYDSKDMELVNLCSNKFGIKTSKAQGRVFFPIVVLTIADKVTSKPNVVKSFEPKVYFYACSSTRWDKMLKAFEEEGLENLYGAVFALDLTKVTDIKTGGSDIAISSYGSLDSLKFTAEQTEEILSMTGGEREQDKFSTQTANLYLSQLASYYVDKETYVKLLSETHEECNEYIAENPNDAAIVRYLSNVKSDTAIANLGVARDVLGLLPDSQATGDVQPADNGPTADANAGVVENPTLSEVQAEPEAPEMEEIESLAESDIPF